MAAMSGAPLISPAPQITRVRGGQTHTPEQIKHAPSDEVLFLGFIFQSFWVLVTNADKY